MRVVLILEYIANLILLMLFNMHMFQLNSYKTKKHLNWLKINIKKIFIQGILILISLILISINNKILDIVSMIVLAISIVYNSPKNKAKISLEFTNRVKRMFVTETILLFIIISLFGIKNYINIKLGLLNIFSFVLCLAANFVNNPIEYLGRKRYINEARKILKNMPNLLVIGVTGSYGKTSMKNYLNKILSGKYEVLVTPKNYNTTMGVVKTIRENLKATHQIFICEMGATKLGDIKEICDIVNPKIGIITAIGPQHLESFKSIDNIIKTKFELYDAVKKVGGTVFINCDNKYLKEHATDCISYGVDDISLNYNAYNASSSSNGLKFKIKEKLLDEEVELETELIGKHNVINLAGAIAVGSYLEIPLQEMVPRVKKIKSVEHRLQLLSRGNINIIDDSYNSNPISSKSALEALSEFEGTKIIVTPGLIELGIEEEKYNFEFGQYMTDICDYIYIVGEQNEKSILDGIRSKKFNEERVFKVRTPQEAMAKIVELNIENKITVLLENDLPDNYN